MICFNHFPANICIGIPSLHARQLVAHIAHESLHNDAPMMFVWVAASGERCITMHVTMWPMAGMFAAEHAVFAVCSRSTAQEQFVALAAAAIATG